MKAYQCSLPSHTCSSDVKEYEQVCDLNRGRCLGSKELNPRQLPSLGHQHSVLATELQPLSFLAQSRLPVNGHNQPVDHGVTRQLSGKWEKRCAFVYFMALLTKTKQKYQECLVSFMVAGKKDDCT